MGAGVVAGAGAAASAAESQEAKSLRRWATMQNTPGREVSTHEWITRLQAGGGGSPGSSILPDSPGRSEHDEVPSAGPGRPGLGLAPGLGDSGSSIALGGSASASVTAAAASAGPVDVSVTSPGGSYQGMVMCRICEEMIPAETFLQHTDACTMASIYEMKVVGIDQQIRALRSELAVENRKRKKRMRRAYSIYDGSGVREAPGSASNPVIQTASSESDLHGDSSGDNPVPLLRRQRAGTVGTASPSRVVTFRDDSPRILTPSPRQTPRTLSVPAPKGSIIRRSSPLGITSPPPVLRDGGAGISTATSSPSPDGTPNLGIGSPSTPPATIGGAGGSPLRPATNSPMSKQRSSGSLLSLVARIRGARRKGSEAEDVSGSGGANTAAGISSSPLQRTLQHQRSWSVDRGTDAPGRDQMAPLERPRPTLRRGSSNSASDLHHVASVSRVGEVKPSAADATTDMFQGRLMFIAEEALQCSDVNEGSVSKMSKLLDRLRELSADTKTYACDVEEMEKMIGVFQRLISQKLQALLSVDAAADADVFAMKARLASGGSNRSMRSGHGSVGSGSAMSASHSRKGSRRVSEPSIGLIPTIHDFEVLKPISRGAYATVHLARKRRTGDLYAMKVIPKDLIATKNMVDTARVERNLMARSAQSPFVVRLFYSFETLSHLFLVMEYMPGGDLYNLLRNVVALPESSAKQYVCEAVLALEWLHSRNIIHRDLKPDNMLVGVSGHVKLTDFGLSKEEVDRKRSVLTLRASGVRDSEKRIGNGGGAGAGTGAGAGEGDDTGEGKEGIKKKVGTPDYLAPETLTGSDHGAVVDWWSLGAIMYELLYGVPPFHGPTPEAVFRNILLHRLSFPVLELSEEDIEEGAEPISDVAIDLIRKLLDADPTKRLGAKGAEEVMSHPWFDGVDWARVLEIEPPFVPDLDDELDTDYFDTKGATEFSLTDVLPRGRDDSIGASDTPGGREDGEDEDEDEITIAPTGNGNWGVVGVEGDDSDVDGDEVMLVPSSPPTDQKINNLLDDADFAELVTDDTSDSESDSDGGGGGDVRSEVASSVVSGRVDSTLGLSGSGSGSGGGSGGGGDGGKGQGKGQRKDRDVSPSDSLSSSSSDDASRRRREVADLGYGFASLASLTALNEGVAREAARMRAQRSATRTYAGPPRHGMGIGMGAKGQAKTMEDVDSELLRRRWAHMSLPVELSPMIIPEGKNHTSPWTGGDGAGVPLIRDSGSTLNRFRPLNHGNA